VVNPEKFKHALIEILPLERLALSQVNDLIDPVSEALAKIGYGQPSRLQGSNILSFRLTNRKRLNQMLSSAVKDEEYEWLISEFYNTLIIAYSSQDILFGQASDLDPNVPCGPKSRTPAYIASEVGGHLAPTSLARLVCATALKEMGALELGSNVDVYTSYPFESALQASIEFVSGTLEFPGFGGIVFRDIDTSITLRPIELISSRRLLSQEIVSLLQEESQLDQLLIARAMPWQWFTTGDKNLGFAVFNHFWIKANSGTFVELVEELLPMALHLNWAHPRIPGAQLSAEQSLTFAIKQSSRLKRLEERESSVRHALGVLQKRYSTRTELYNLEVNNQYSNLVRYSPIYSRWKRGLDLSTRQKLKNMDRDT